MRKHTEASRMQTKRLGTTVRQVQLGQIRVLSSMSKTGGRRQRNQQRRGVE